MTQEYRYDTLNRIVVSAENPGSTVTASTTCPQITNAWCRNFAYTYSTANGYSNMYVPYNQGLSEDPTTPAAASNFDSNNRLNSTIWSYDASGNQLTTGSGSYVNTYDAENRMKSSAIGGVTTTYNYDGDGHRVQKSRSGVTTTYVYDAGWQLAAEYMNTAPTTAPCTTCYLTADHLGSTRMITGAGGTVWSLHDYLPFGEEITATVNGRSSTFYPPSALAINDTVTQKFTGKERDTETGLDNFGKRYFSGSQGRWASPDLVNVTDKRLRNPSSTLNKYSYDTL